MKKFYRSWRNFVKKLKNDTNHLYNILQDFLLPKLILFMEAILSFKTVYKSRGKLVFLYILKYNLKNILGKEEI